MTCPDRRRRKGLWLRWALCVAACVTASAQRQFRTGVDLVSIEVRVVDGDGVSIEDLSADDFIVSEAEQVQSIAHFERIALDLPDGHERGRIFFIVLGVGRLNYPTKAIDALIDFVRLQTLPADRVGLAAHLRVIDPTTDKAAILRFLEAFKSHNDSIAGWMEHDWNRMTFPLPKQLTETTARELARLWSKPNVSFRVLAGGSDSALNRHSDFSYLRQSLDYLRLVPGEKHTIFVSDSILGRAFDDPLKNFWFLAAVNARTSLSHIHSGGASSDGMLRGRLTTEPVFNVIDPRNIRDEGIVTGQTGGLAAFYKFAREPLADIDRMTRHYYVLGYYPNTDASAGGYRRIEVSLRRPGARVFYRQAYNADPPPLDGVTYRTLLVESRLEQGAQYILNPPQITHIVATPIRWTMRLDRPRWEPSPTGGRVHVSVAFEPHPSWTTYTRKGDRYVSDSELLLLADDDSRKVLAQRRMRIRIELTEKDFKQASRKWFTHEVSIEVDTPPAWLRAVMYDFESDRSAGAEVRLRR